MHTAGFPVVRPRRLRANPLVRAMVRETALHPRDFILPLFVRPGTGVRQEISSMPGNYQLSVDRLVEEVGAAADDGVRAFLLFGIPTYKDASGSSALRDDGIVQQALRALRSAYQGTVVLLTDECFCEYTNHGHCGPLAERDGRVDVDNDATLPLLAQQCVSHGCTVHLITADLDDGPILLQAEVPVLVSDTAETLSARVLTEEHRIYPRALAMLARRIQAKIST